MDTRSLVLRVKNLIKSFGIQYTAVNNVSFELTQGEILGLLGPNGAGKTTIIQMLLGIMTPTSGVIEYFGKNFFTHRSKALQDISFASTYVRLPGRLTVYENLRFQGKLYGFSVEELSRKIPQLLDTFGIGYLAQKKAGMLSAGESTRVMLVKAFLTNPKIVLLDEPTASLDPDAAQIVRQIILQQREEAGTSFLVTSHDMDEVAEVCDRVLVLKKGTIIANDTPAHLAASVASTKVHFIADDYMLDQIIGYSKQRSLACTREGHTVSVEVYEHAIAGFLMDLAHAKITYSTISIDKPSLEDYFLTIAKS